GDSLADQLIEILVARHDDGLEAARGRTLRERGDDVIRLVAVDGDDGNVKRVEYLADALERAVEILLEFLSQLFARGLVFGILLLAKRHAPIVYPADVLGMIVLVEPEQKIRDAPDRRCILAPLGRQRPCDHGEKRAIDQRIAVD